MTLALEGGEWSSARPGRTLPLGKTRYPFYRRLGGSQGRSGRAENLVPTGIRSQTVQPPAPATAYSCAYLAAVVVMYIEKDVLQSYRLSLLALHCLFYDAVDIAGNIISNGRMNGERLLGMFWKKTFVI